MTKNVTDMFIVDDVIFLGYSLHIPLGWLTSRRGVSSNSTIKTDSNYSLQKNCSI